MKRLRILLVGIVLLALFGFLYATRNAGEVLTSYTFIAVNAPAEKTWAILTDLSSYPSWNPYVVEVEGSLAVGKKLKIDEQVDGKRHTRTVRVTCLDVSTHELRWEGSLVPAMLLKWDEGFLVEAVDASHSRVAMVNSHQGLLAKMYRKYNQNRDLKAFREFGAALKKRAEQ
jgi:hypothetical protein